MPDRRDLIIIGGGEHARVIAEAARSRPDEWNVLGFTDPQPCNETTNRLGLRRFNDDHDIQTRVNDSWFIIGIASLGSSSTRRRLVESYDRVGARWATIVHTKAWVSPTANLQPGVAVLAGAVVQTGATIGRHAVVNTTAVVEHDVMLGEFAVAAPGAVIGGGAAIGGDSYLGLGCLVRDHIRIGSGVTVGMGAVVVKNLPDGVTAVGVPAAIVAPN